MLCSAKIEGKQLEKHVHLWEIKKKEILSSNKCFSEGHKTNVNELSFPSVGMLCYCCSAGDVYNFYRK